MGGGLRVVGACLACGGTETRLAKGAWFGVGDSKVAVGLHDCGVTEALESCLSGGGFLFASGSGLGLRRGSSRVCVVCSGVLVRRRVASCSSTRRLVEVSVVVVVVLRACDDCDPDLLSPEAFRSRSFAALAGRDCCWRRAAEARRSATDAPREGGLEAIVEYPHSIGVCEGGSVSHVTAFRSLRTCRLVLAFEACWLAAHWRWRGTRPKPKPKPKQARLASVGTSRRI